MENLTTEEAAVAGGIIGSTMAVMGLVALAMGILGIIATWRIFSKAGEKGWKSLIPIYNLYIAYKIVGMNFWGWFLSIFATSFIAGLFNTIQISNDGQVTMVGNNVFGYIMFFASVVISIVAEVLFCIRLAKAFKKGTGFTIGLVLFPYIFMLILGFGSAKYDKKRALKK